MMPFSSSSPLLLRTTLSQAGSGKGEKYLSSLSPPHTLIFANMKLFLPLFSHLAEEKKTKKEEKVSPSFRPLLLLFFLLNMRAYITGARRRRRRWRKKGEKGEKLFLPPPHFSFSSASLLLHLNAFVFRMKENAVPLLSTFGLDCFPQLAQRRYDNPTFGSRTYGMQCSVLCPLSSETLLD